MKYRMSANYLLVLAFVLISWTNAAAGGQHGPGADRMQQVDRDRTRQIDRDRMSGRDRAQDRARIAVPEQDRHRLESRDPSQLRDDEIYGYRLMTEEERREYRDLLAKAPTIESRMTFEAQHEQAIQKRALESGQDLVPPGQGPVYGSEYMTTQERNRYREQLRWLDSDKERKRFMEKHRRRMDERAHALGHSITEPQ